MKTVGVWFRKCLRLHDNAALVDACKSGDHVVCFFVLDPWFDHSKVGVNRFRFLLESLHDLDSQLKKSHNSRLLVIRGKPSEVIGRMVGGSSSPSTNPNTKAINFKIDKLCFEFDSEPYAVKRDEEIEKLCLKAKVDCAKFSGHTLLDLAAVKGKLKKPPIDMKAIEGFVKEQLGTTGCAGGKVKINVPKPLPVPAKIPPLPKSVSSAAFAVPALADLGLYPAAEVAKTKAKKATLPSSAELFPGGEQEALKRLQRRVVNETKFVCDFEKPKTASTNLPSSEKHGNFYSEPSTTGLSPYIKFGCVSIRTVWHAVQTCYDKAPNGKHAVPPMSLHGQLLFREMFYVLSFVTPNWDQPENNAMCKPIAWAKKDEKLLKAWETGHTGYPFIDALMRQLNETGWMHHLGRHAVSCFLTRGDLYQHWVHGRDVFDKLLLDADWALNNGNWMWLAGVAPFSMPFFRVYAPTPDKTAAVNAEQSGEFVKRFVPELKEFPAKYIYKPWTAPIEVQKKANCVIGKDYPAPVVDHGKARDLNLNNFKKSLDEIKAGKKVLSDPVGDVRVGKGGGKGKGQSSTGSPAVTSAAVGKGGSNKRNSSPGGGKGGAQPKITDFFAGGPPMKKRKS
mmetsp:Transcript_18028/g.45096  ORF Transcript_18028/g.45096 Transcript_18028/m.45096 type:complete len:620 (+) Transcript_18028:220-2079(+)|eukprot:CAMPEP_0178999262 /NCGR_PEP_ID=MMETSP0795-20121207/9954_1 /TAXON_ID=88552 /ORGANISM="Amoebophrya sp., Strain Ameob2" /LENGTH=619 /DNA_ID=CAMNT_0020691999 /DNA_START=152 /DNA_END=2011 /DNA_ORIENTATION=+